MRIGFVVNDIATEAKGYTTTRLGMQAINQGHEVWVMGVGDLIYNTNDTVSAHARSVNRESYKSTETYLKELQGPKAKQERITLDDLDVLLLRNDPSDDTAKRPWAVSAGIIFGRMAMRGGVIVLNNPDGLAKATNKMYFQGFPEEVRPSTIITRNRNEVRAFAKEHGGNIVLKPLQGSGGEGVFLVRQDDMSNLNQIIETLSRDGYVIAQEYLPGAEEGDTRLFLMNGQPMRHRGKYAAFRRIRTGDDMRSNVSAGGTIAKATIDDSALRIAEIVRPKLVADGMFLVGLDIVGDKLMEINVFSPGGLGSAQRYEKVNFSNAVLEALERKVDYGKFYRRNFDNVDMNTL
ncbi:MAG: glutathione synthase [Chloroflexi bacterium]|nr:MAG: glutathione synthase [Chloroflexota bacterium]MBL1195098.1 glutathione synthase [Chloroflexota bacterium]NOH12384.1 glutathione synthase [Chloroflexota bacterium]